jgi:hypothetical membrane protein
VIPGPLDRRVLVGGACWALTVVFFVGQGIAEAASAAPYSLSDSYISALGATRCGTFTSGAYHAEVCSPLHWVMNSTFVITGLLMALGAVASWPGWPRRRRSAAGLILLVLGGAGQALAGLRPEDVDLGLHSVGALFGILGSSVGVLLLGLSVRPARPALGYLSLLVGFAGMVGFVLTAVAPGMRVGVGLAERLAVYPTVIWLIAVGVWLVWPAVSRKAGDTPRTG